MNVIAFAGFKHVGKTYWGQILSESYKIPFIDLDWLLEQQFNMPIKEVYKSLGRERFHDAELDILKHLDFSSKAILSLGGSTLLNKQSLELLNQNAKVLHLEDNFETLKERILRAPSLWAALDPCDLDGSFLALYLDRMAYLRSLGLKTFNLDNPNGIQQLEEYVEKFFW